MTPHGRWRLAALAATMTCTGSALLAAGGIGLLTGAPDWARWTVACGSVLVITGLAVSATAP